MAEFIIKRIDQEKDIDSQIRVYREAFEATETLDETKTRWTTKHYQNPYKNSYIFGAYDGDLLVGINAFMPVPYKINGSRVNIVQSCESGVLVSYRGKGLWSKILKFAIAYFENETDVKFIYGFPNIKNSYPGFVKMGWKTVTDVRNLIMINNGKEFSKLFTKSGKSLGLAKICEAQKFIINLKADSKKYAVSPCAISDIKIQKGLCSDATYNIDISKEWLKWKAECNRLQVVKVENNGQGVAYCIFSNDRYDGVSTIRLYSIASCISKNTNKAIVATCLEYLSTHYREAAFIRFWATPDSQEVKMSKGLGFLTSKHRNPFIVFGIQNNRDQKAFFENYKYWNLSFMDLD